MWFVRVENITRQTVLCERCLLAESFWGRLRGLLGRPPLREGEGMLLVPAKGGIHTFFLPSPIDIAYLSPDLRVVALFPEMRPWRIWFPKAPNAPLALELPPGTLAKTGTQAGDRIRVTLIWWRG